MRTAERESIGTKRKAELIKAAEELFQEKGFENTSVDDIIKKVGVAKGLFYYYFCSKEDLIDILTKRMLEDVENSVKSVLEIEGLDAKQRFLELFNSQREVNLKSEIVIEYFANNRNKNIHYEIERLAHEIIVPAMVKIIEQGIDEGIFNTIYPLETAYVIDAIFDHSVRVMKASPNQENIHQHTKVVQYLIEKVLGMEEGSFDIYEKFINTCCPDYIATNEK